MSKALVDLAIDVAKPKTEAEIDAAVAKELAAASTRLTALAEAGRGGLPRSCRRRTST